MRYENYTATDLLRELFETVKGECPSLLNEDSGGDGDLCIAIEDCLRAADQPTAVPCADCADWEKASEFYTDRINELYGRLAKYEGAPDQPTAAVNSEALDLLAQLQYHPQPPHMRDRIDALLKRVAADQQSVDASK
jgi:hypothetical protein